MENEPFSTTISSSPWAVSAGSVAAALGTDVNRGLDLPEVDNRLRKYGKNELEQEPVVPVWRRFVSQVNDPLSVLLIAATAISAGAWLVEGGEGAPVDAIVIIIIVIANAALGLWQEAQADEAVSALQQMTAPSATLLRSGLIVDVPATGVVPGDVMILAEGDAIVADGRLVEVATLKVAEAALTGESESVVKGIAPIDERAVIGDRSNTVFGGTSVVTGHGKAVVVATGMQSEVGRIAGLLSGTPDEPTPLSKEIERVGRILGLAVILIVIVVVATIAITSDISTTDSFVDVMLIGVSLAVAAVPEGLSAILSVVLALGVKRLAENNAVVKHLSAVETLGSASVICTDKTGTLTKNEMTIRELVTPSGSASLTGVGYRPEGDVQTGDVVLTDGPLLDEVRLLIGAGSLANTASIRMDGPAMDLFGDPTELAFLIAGRKLGIDEIVSQRFRRIGDVPFTSERRLMSSLALDRDEHDQPFLITKGAPDVVLERCKHERVSGDVVELSEERRIAILHQVNDLADRALRTLAVAYRPLSTVDGVPEAAESLEHDLVYLGVVGIIDPPRPEAAAAVTEAHRAGIGVLMITGDHPSTAERIAENLGIADGSEPVHIGQEIEVMSLEELRRAVSGSSVFARVAPEHKLRIVAALKTQGHIVAMTGDGVNDAPALKAADIGVAMGQTGTEVSRQAADMILADDNFATIVLAAGEGRAIFANIRKFLRYLLSSNIGEVLTVFLGIVFAGLFGLEGIDAGVVAVPLLATQILWINLLTDSAPALALGVDPAVEDLMARPPRRLNDRVIDSEMLASVLMTGVVMALATLLAFDARLPGGFIDGNSDLAHARTVAFTTLVLAQLFNTFNARSATTSAFVGLGRNRLLWGAIALSILLQMAVVYIPFLNTAFSTTPLSAADWFLAGGAASAVLWFDEVRKLTQRHIRGS